MKKETRIIKALWEERRALQSKVRHLGKFNDYVHKRAITFLGERDCLQLVIAVFAEKLFHIVTKENFHELWVLGEDGNYYHPLNYFIHTKGQVGGCDLRLDGFVVEMNINTISEAKDLALLNYLEVKAFNP